MSLLSKLTFLVIENNKLTGGIPPFLGNITSMEVFAAANNPFGGSIPDTLGLWKNLKEFYSGGCNLYGSIPHSIFNLSLLVNFSLANNHLTGSLPSEIGVTLPNLEYLQLRTNELTGVLPPSISNCSKLRHLEMSHNNFSGKLTVDFSKLRDIYKIRLQHNNFHGRGEADDMRFINSLRNCTRLVDLELYNCNLTGVLPVSIGNLSHQLSSLWLGRNQLFGSLPSSIGPIPNAIGNLSMLNKLYLYLIGEVSSYDDMVAHVGDFGLARLLGTDLNQNSSTGVKGTIGYAPPEYGIGSEMTSSGDVYSFGILLLELMTGKKPTDDMFNEGLSIHKFASMALPDHVVDVIDGDAIVLQSTEANAKKVEECLTATIKIGVSCSVDSPPQRMKIEIVVIELQRILDVLQNI
ncbi:leucine-rich repeat protein [Tanacetum coccineum]